MSVNHLPMHPAANNCPPTAMPATANTNRDGTGTFTKIFTAGKDGARIDRIRFKAQGTTTAGQILLAVMVAGGGSKIVFAEVAVLGIVPSASVASEEPLYAPAGGPLSVDLTDEIWAAPTKAEAFNAYVDAGNL